MKIGHKIANLFQTYPYLKSTKFPEFVKIVEVGPRDGLQNEKEILKTNFKIDLINNLSNTGLSVIEATSFVSPKWVPQMSDNKEVYCKIIKGKSIHYPVLVPNKKGMESALECGVKEIALFTAASESFTKKNINCSIDESFSKFEEVIELAKKNDIKIRGYVSCVLGCPYEGEIDPNKVNEVAERLFKLGCYEVSLGDTIGKGSPEKTSDLLDALKVDKTKIAGHFHNTYDRAIENMIISLSKGISVFDSSVGGLGGCPYAEGASGNVATEDLLYALEILGCKTNVDIEKIIKIGEDITSQLKLTKRSSVSVSDLKDIELYRKMLI